VHYTLDGKPVGLGFDLTTDALQVVLAPLDLHAARVRAHLASPTWRTNAFLTAVAEDVRLDGIANGFQRNWLTLVYLTAFVLSALENQQAPDVVHAALSGGNWRNDLTNVFQVLYRDDRAPAARQRLIDGLTELSTNLTITEVLDQHGRLLWVPDIVADTAHLAQRAYRETIAAAILQAAIRACPDAQDDDLIVDVLAPPTSEPATIWVTETSLGGLGVIEQLVSTYSSGPQRFWGLVDTALGPGDYEHIDGALTRLVDHVVADPNGAAAGAIGRIRNARSASEADEALQDLRAAWARLDGYPRHAAVAALSARLLRPGSSATTDSVAQALVHAWDALQQRLGFEVNAQVIAYAARADKLAPLGVNTTLTADQVFSILWPRGSAARNRHLEHYQPYATNPLLDRLLVSAAHDEQLPEVDVTLPDWTDQYRTALSHNGAAVLIASTEHSDQLGRAVRSVPAIAIDRDALRVYGNVHKTARLGTQLRAVVHIPEADQ
jgi:ATP-dependent Lhr-like helicase